MVYNLHFFVFYYIENDGITEIVYDRRPDYLMTTVVANRRHKITVITKGKVITLLRFYNPIESFNLIYKGLEGGGSWSFSKSNFLLREFEKILTLLLENEQHLLPTKFGILSYQQSDFHIFQGRSSWFVFPDLDGLHGSTVIQPLSYSSVANCSWPSNEAE